MERFYYHWEWDNYFVFIFLDLSIERTFIPIQLISNWTCVRSNWIDEFRFSWILLMNIYVTFCQTFQQRSPLNITFTNFLILLITSMHYISSSFTHSLSLCFVISCYDTFVAHFSTLFYLSKRSSPSKWYHCDCLLW